MSESRHDTIDWKDRFALDRSGDAYALMASGKCGKVAVCADEELKK